jgi:hypothetical protein
MSLTILWFKSFNASKLNSSYIIAALLDYPNSPQCLSHALSVYLAQLAVIIGAHAKIAVCAQLSTFVLNRLFDFAAACTSPDHLVLLKHAAHQTAPITNATRKTAKHSVRLV